MFAIPPRTSLAHDPAHGPPLTADKTPPYPATESFSGGERPNNDKKDHKPMLWGHELDSDAIPRLRQAVSARWTPPPPLPSAETEYAFGRGR
ncbi:hypothetical protein PG985_007906 [Apiospora marii]|uniref:uncharacterized protein n=1 Tax=Apiospora marii TaxID=335849 RepID=UPI003130DE20